MMTIEIADWFRHEGKNSGRTSDCATVTNVFRYRAAPGRRYDDVSIAFVAFFLRPRNPAPAQALTAVRQPS
jgi:hypothetical protein